MKILLLDSDSGRRNDLKYLLELHNNEVVSAYDYEVADQIIKENFGNIEGNFDLFIIRSINGEGKREVSLKDKARAKFPDIKVITTIHNTGMDGLATANEELPPYSVIYTDAITKYLKHFKIIT